MESTEIIDYGNYIVQRYNSPTKKIESTVTPEKKIAESLEINKEALRNSLNEYEKLIEKQKLNEKNISPIFSSSKKKAHTGNEVIELKQEITRLSQELTGYKKSMNETLKELKLSLEKMTEKVGTIEPAQATKSDFFKEGYNPINSEPGGDIQEEELEKAVEDIKDIKCNLMEEIKEREIAAGSEIKQLDLPEEAHDQDLFKTDEFILKKMSKISQEKELLKSFN